MVDESVTSQMMQIGQPDLVQVITNHRQRGEIFLGPLVPVPDEYEMFRDEAAQVTTTTTTMKKKTNRAERQTASTTRTPPGATELGTAEEAVNSVMIPVGQLELASVLTTRRHTDETVHGRLVGMSAEEEISRG